MGKLFNAKAASRDYFTGAEPKASRYGEIGRRAGFRIPYFGVRVRVSLSV